jgi:Ca2+-binding RTX toxin-like protein
VRRLGLTVVASLTLALTYAGGAFAATVEVRPLYYKPVHEGDEVRYQAEPGERNRPVITVEADSVLITDAVDLDAGRGCVAEAGGAVRCTPTPNLEVVIRVLLGDSDDRVRVAGSAFATLKGGPGNDRLAGSPDWPRGTLFDGGPGNDRMLGGSGWDRFAEGRAANGADTIASRPNAPGVSDTADYRQRRKPVHVTLDARRDDGEAGERDRIGPNVRGIEGGDGADVLIGGPLDDYLDGNVGRDKISGKGGDDSLEGDALIIELKNTADRLNGGSGDDIIKGGSGPDRITGGSGEDSVMAGPGDDRVDSDDGEMDFVGCGDGQDRVAIDLRDLLNPDCEERRRLQPDRDAGRAHALLGLADRVRAVVEDRRA